jgi:hypothetical protein
MNETKVFKREFITPVSVLETAALLQGRPRGGATGGAVLDANGCRSAGSLRS